MLFAQAGGTTFEPKAQAGREAEVITTIPAEGLGEITFHANSGRISGPARSTKKTEIRSGTVVVIDRFIGGNYYVTDVAAKDERAVAEKKEDEGDEGEDEPSTA